MIDTQDAMAGIDDPPDWREICAALPAEESSAIDRITARRMVDEWLRPTAEQHAATMERLATVTYQITLASINLAAIRGTKFLYDA